jgi:hypothetical protein
MIIKSAGGSSLIEEGERDDSISFLFELVSTGVESIVPCSPIQAVTYV